MAKEIKTRSVYAYDSFRGLCTDIKPVRTNKQRATYIKNLISDGGSLKTRPSFSLSENNLFVPYHDGEDLIDRYFWNEYKCFVFVTTQKISIYDNGSYTNFTYELENKKPIFVEEKTRLFIFGLKELGILVIQKTNDEFECYKLSDDDTDENHIVPYIPTLYQIGSTPKRIDYYNLLSKKYKYSVFRDDSVVDNYILPADNYKGNYSVKIKLEGSESENIAYTDIEATKITDSSSGELLAYKYDVEDYQYDYEYNIDLTESSLSFKTKESVNEVIRNRQYDNITPSEGGEGNHLYKIEYDFDENWEKFFNSVEFIETSDVYDNKLIHIDKYVFDKENKKLYITLSTSDGSTISGRLQIWYKYKSNIITSENTIDEFNNCYDDTTSKKVIDFVRELVENSDISDGDFVRFNIRNNIKINDEAVNAVVSVIYSIKSVDSSELLEYSEKNDAFLIKKEYLNSVYNINNEPALEIEVENEEDDNYRIISDSQIYAIFGQENRLLLAGNEKYPNICRYNTSNDLLSTDERQNYELSYFPSHNYNVVGGKGAINGFSVASDNVLYITKKEYPNDSKIFIRSRNLDDNGIVVYTDVRTNIIETPINDKCIVRFLNDTIILSENGIFGLELNENVLTDERLIKHRDRLVNKDIVETLKSRTSEPFIVCNTNKMYIFIGNICYFIDYTQRYEDEFGGINYEIYKLELNNIFNKAVFENGNFELTCNKYLYRLSNNFFDEVVDETFIIVGNNEISIDISELENNDFCYFIENNSFVKYEYKLIENTVRFYKDIKDETTEKTFNDNEIYNLILVKNKDIIQEWVSNISDFGNNLFEKTMFRLNVYATKQESSNTFTYGYRTSRTPYYDVETIVANKPNFNDMFMNMFTFANFDESGFSHPLKVNNFLYIQFYIKAVGKVDINSIEISYKSNRQLKGVN